MKALKLSGFGLLFCISAIIGCGSLPLLDAPWERQPLPKDDVYITGIGYSESRAGGQEDYARTMALGDANKKCAMQGFENAVLQETDSFMKRQGKVIGVKVLYKVVLPKKADDQKPKLIADSGWGPAVNGLQCRITSDKRVYLEGESVKITFIIRNVSDEPKSYSCINIGGLRSYDYTHFMVTDSRDKKHDIRFILERSKCSPGDIPLLPQQSYEHLQILNKGEGWGEDTIKPGTYAITAEYETGHLISNKISIECRGNETQESTPELQAKIAKLIQQLGDDKFETREAAQNELLALGEIIIPELAQALQNADMQIKMSAQLILKSFDMISDEQLKKTAERYL
ncbi:MAG: hypothetical protein V1701_06260 [Planctomycetota bacterium]